MNFYGKLADNFYRWEQRGRGTLTHTAPVELEPPFIPFPGHRVDFGPTPDHGTKHTFLSRLTSGVVKLFQPPLELSQPRPAEPAPRWLTEDDGEPQVEFLILLPPDLAVASNRMAHFFTTLSAFTKPVTLEIIGQRGEILIQLVCHEEDANTLDQQLAAQFPEAKVEWSRDTLQTAWLGDGEEESEHAVQDFALCEEFMLPLESVGKIDPFGSLLGGMSSLAENEAAVYQVIFTPAREEWADHIFRSVTKNDGSPFFHDGAHLVKGMEEKLSCPLFAVVLRLAARAGELDRAWDIITGMVPALEPFSRHRGQSFTPLPNGDYSREARHADVLSRRSHRPGMILNLEELLGLAHWPSPAVRAPGLLRLVDSRTRPAPECDGPDGIRLGLNEHEGEVSEVMISGRQRVQHIHCVGGSGTGKSTFMLSMILQDLWNGQGFALIDPHGDLADRVLSEIPASRMRDVVLINPADEDHVTPFNVLSAHSDHEKNLLASDLVSVFRRLSTTWGDRMEIIFKYLVLAFLEHPQGGTLADMRRFLISIPWRAAFLAGVTDPDVRLYWEQVFPKFDGAKSVGPILTRLETFLAPKIIRYMVSQRENLIDFGEIMDQGRILIVRLPMGQIGKDNAFMLGSLLMVKLQQLAMGRARMAEKDRTPFFCYVDECQHFVTPSMSEILSGARKYGLGLVLAHQDLHQLSQNKDVEAAVMTNAATRVVFRVSESDARTLKGDFAHYDLKDFAELPNMRAICRIGRADQDFNLLVIRPDDPDPAEADETRAAVIAESRSRHTIPRTEVEARIQRETEEDDARAKTAKPEKTKAGKASKASEAAPKVETPQVSAPVVEVKPSAVSESSPEPSPAVETRSETKLETKLEAASVPMETTDAVEAAADNNRPVGGGVGGDDHKLIVARLSVEGQKLGYVVKEKEVRAGRVDLLLHCRGHRFAFEVASHSYTAHELDNLTKCLAEGFEYVVAVSAQPNTLKNIERAARKTFTPEELAKLRFLSPDAVPPWLAEIAAGFPPEPPPPSDTIIVGGRRVVKKRIEMSASEQEAFEKRRREEIAAILIKKPPQ